MKSEAPQAPPSEDEVFPRMWADLIRDVRLYTAEELDAYADMPQTAACQ